MRIDEIMAMARARARKVAVNEQSFIHGYIDGFHAALEYSNSGHIHQWGPWEYHRGSEGGGRIRHCIIAGCRARQIEAGTGPRTESLTHLVGTMPADMTTEQREAYLREGVEALGYQLPELEVRMRSGVLMHRGNNDD